MVPHAHQAQPGHLFPPTTYSRLPGVSWPDLPAVAVQPTAGAPGVVGERHRLQLEIPPLPPWQIPAGMAGLTLLPRQLLVLRGLRQSVDHQ